MKPLVLIPAYKPGATLIQLVEALSASTDIAGVIVVDDGSGPGYCHIFEALTHFENVWRLAHVVNLGKGAALKLGLNFAACQFPSSIGVVTADADGQHAPADILKLAAALTASPRSLILGARAFEGDVPWRSRLGNEITRRVMRAVTGQKISDTQTGLRGIPLSFIGDLIKLPAAGYDFELDMLLLCRDTRRKIIEVSIATIYLEGNRSSHFNPLRDSMRIYFVFLRFVSASLMTAAIDNSVFILVLKFYPSILVGQIAARFVAGNFNYFVGRYGVFHSKASHASSFPRYWLSIAIFGVLSYVLIRNVVAFTSLPVIPAKLCTETFLFFFSFMVQRDFVYHQSESESA